MPFGGKRNTWPKPKKRIKHFERLNKLKKEQEELERSYKRSDREKAFIKKVQNPAVDWKDLR